MVVQDQLVEGTSGGHTSDHTLIKRTLHAGDGLRGMKEKGREVGSFSDTVCNSADHTHLCRMPPVLVWSSCDPCCGDTIGCWPRMARWHQC
jgi:hypothetical protein